MREDYLEGLVHQVKEEVVENYLFNRRVIEEQVEEVHELVGRAQRYAELVGKRFLSIFGLLIAPRFIKEFISIIGIEQVRPFEFFGADLDMKKIYKIRAEGFTLRSRYRKLLVEAYGRLLRWSTQYAEAYGDLHEEVAAVNKNIKWFQEEFDLLAIIHFLKSLDVVELERKHFLGGNFTAKELASVDQKLLIRPLKWDSLEVPKPLDLPDTKLVRKGIESLADRVFDEYRAKLRERIL